MNSYTKTLCVKCNDFYGSEERKGMCSVCFKKYTIPDEPKFVEPKFEEPVKVEQPVEEVTKPLETIEPIEPVEAVKEVPSKPVQTNTMNCWTCNVKVGYLGFKCHCEYVFCGKHRHFSEHKCDFDYKNYDRSKLKAATEGKKVK
jgi:hypothetical protein